jgi:broad specificity phosphatase PhoE
MKTIEIRRHSIRTKPGQHLSQQGVTLARQVGQDLGPFDHVVTSTAPRAFETAIAMGFAVDEQNELMSTYGVYVEWEVSWPSTPTQYAKAVRKDGAAAQYSYQLAHIYRQLADDLPEGGSALVINHGGVLELGAVACLPDADHASWGEHFGYCEGME